MRAHLLCSIQEDRDHCGALELRIPLPLRGSGSDASAVEVPRLCRTTRLGRGLVALYISQVLPPHRSSAYEPPGAAMYDVTRDGLLVVALFAWL